ncbi:hypothetical protein LUZ63_013828 [Rhynchospora breviuscula]|uniref:Uncharacterized protein n=1 Tax=Rhynchospora breviuscula TaxID=2022672 RepID=A0A9Q0C9E3_9POAL|nr:hypothetical protein LUZ63_013828 [Rhynchospora breviuscula]
MERSKSADMMARYRFPVSDTDFSDHVECTECSTQTCQSCSAFVMGDCIALCCCPCSFVHLLAFSLVKAPYLVGRRCYRILRKKKGLLQKRISDAGESDGEVVVGVEYKGFDDKSGELGMGVWGIGLGEYKNISNGRLSTKIDADKVWMDLYQVGHWGFGRISFSTNPLAGTSFGKDVVVYQNLKDLKAE